MGIEERYYKAMSSTDLKMEAHRVKDIDVILAHGMNGSRLGLALMRLRSQCEAPSMRMPGSREGDGDLICLPELPRVYAGVLHAAAQRGWDESMVPAAIDHFLRPNCKKCKGTGEISTAGVTKVCPKCRGSCNRSAPAALDDVIRYLQDCCASARGTARKRLNLHRR